MRLHPSKHESGVALVTTVIVIAVLAVVAVAFMQSTTSDRFSSRSVVNYARAKLAAEAGLGVAQFLINTSVGSDRSFIVAETNHSPDYSPILLIGTNDASIATNMVPLMSGPVFDYLANGRNLEQFLASRASADPTQTVDLNLGAWQVIQNTNAADWYRAPWVYVTNVTTLGSSPATNLFRYAFLVLDEQARLNPLLHRGLEATARTNLGRNAEEIRLDSEAAPIVADEAEVSRIQDAAGNILTPQTLALLLGADFESVKHLVSVHTAIDEDIIPSGYLVKNASGTNFAAYADAGKPKYNLNDLATNTIHGSSAEVRALKIAGIISSNLPDFFRRDVGSATAGLAGNLYPTRLAASIVDYIDADAIPTAGLDGEPAGKELAPYVVMVAEKNAWISEDPPPPATNNIKVKIQTQFFVQLWNPYTVPVSGAVGFQVQRRQYVELPNGGTQTDFNDYTPAVVQLSPPLGPNEMRAIAFDPVEQEFVNPVARPSAKKDNYPRWPQTSSASSDLTGHPQFRLTWNGVVIDMNRQAPEFVAPARSGLVKSATGGNFGPVGAIRWGFNFCPPNAPNTVGDPRATSMSESDWAAAANIASAMWQGRQTDTGGRSQNFQQLWSSRDYVRANLPQGTALASSNANPLAIPSTYQEANDARNAPVFLRNSKMLSIGELGNIFDPAQANDAGISQSGTTQGFFRPAGGRSLRIGQAESPYWDVGGQRASQLLDLFTLNPLGTNVSDLGSSVYTNIPIMRGRINVNTAPRPVLASVFEGLTLSADRGISSSSADASKISDAVIANRPYSRISDLYKVGAAFANGTNYEPVVTNTIVTVSNAVAGTSTNYDAMAAMDRAREELFARSINLLGTQSRAFRVFVVGEALDARSNALSRVSLEASIQLKPRQGQSGFVQEIKFKKTQ
jgi:type II secretory pathway component PulK